MLRNISSSFGGICDVKRRICPVLGSGTRKVSDKSQLSSTMPDQGKRWRILRRFQCQQRNFSKSSQLLTLPCPSSFSSRTLWRPCCRPWCRNKSPNPWWSCDESIHSRFRQRCPSCTDASFESLRRFATENFPKLIKVSTENRFKSHQKLRPSQSGQFNRRNSSPESRVRHSLQAANEDFHVLLARRLIEVEVSPSAVDFVATIGETFVDRKLRQFTARLNRCRRRDWSDFALFRLLLRQILLDRVIQNRLHAKRPQS